ncbi:MAG: hypothetical protein QOI35_2263, partial [Cryptosporangiaceae bacterium]|nr:hypothetical protein [Cryptosporangiaceae bacterium]
RGRKVRREGAGVSGGWLGVLVGMRVMLRTTWVQAGGLPVCCSRHGGPATVPAGAAPRWLVGPAAVLVGAVAAVLGRRIVSRGWPYCAECRDERTLRLTAGAALCAVSPLPWLALVATRPVAGVAETGTSATILSALIGLLLLGTGLGFAAAGAWQWLCGALVSANGEWVLVRGRRVSAPAWAS